MATPATTTVEQTHKLTSTERNSIITTVVLFVALAFAAWLGYRQRWLLVLALSVGGLGGLFHEIAQSRGKILFFQKLPDGLYIGTVAGIVLGAVAGVLVIRGYLTGEVTATNASFVQMSYEAFLAGLALKGIAEAAGTKDTQ
jgi:hypothetical protein